MKKIAILGIGCVLGIGASAAFPATIHVPADKPTIQAGVDQAIDGDTVLVSPGVYQENVSVVAKTIVLVGDTDSYGVTLRAATDTLAVIKWVNVTSLDAQVAGFIIENAWRASGILCQNSSPTVRKNIIRYNRDSGIRVRGSATALIEDNSIYGNSAYGGGGISLDEGGADVRRNQIYANTAALGAAIFSDNRIALAAKLAAGEAAPDFEIEGNVIRGNHARDGGGGIYFYEGFPVTVDRNLFVEDTSFFGGGIDNSGRANLHVLNNTFDRCVCEGGGGNALWWAHAGQPGGILKNNIFSNCPSTSGVTAAVGGDPDVVGTVDVGYNDTWGNFPADYDAFAPGPGAISANPLYCNPAADDYTVIVCSPCVGSGEGGADIGAFGPNCSLTDPLAISLSLLGEVTSHVVSHVPTFVWSFLCPSGQLQSEYEIEVGSDPDWSAAEMWQPGSITSATASVAYAGLPLLDGVTYYGRVRTNDGSAWSAWVTQSFHMNSPPGPPILYIPPDGWTITYSSPLLQALPGADPENDAQQIQFKVYGDAGMTTLVASRPFGADYWHISPPLPASGEYWWRARAMDGFETGPWSAPSTLFFNPPNNPPLPFALISPGNGSVVPDVTPFLQWESAVDNDPGDGISSYTLFLATDSGFVFSVQFPDLMVPNCTPAPLPFGQRYWWKVRAYDRHGNMRESAVQRFVIPAPGDVTGDMIYNVVDVVTLIDYIFRGLPLQGGTLAIDLNGDC